MQSSLERTLGLDMDRDGIPRADVDVYDRFGSKGKWDVSTTANPTILRSIRIALAILREFIGQERDSLPQTHVLIANRKDMLSLSSSQEIQDHCRERPSALGFFDSKAGETVEIPKMIYGVWLEINRHALRPSLHGHNPDTNKNGVVHFTNAFSYESE